MLSNLIKKTGMSDDAIAMSCVVVMRAMLNELRFQVEQLIKENEITNSLVTERARTCNEIIGAIRDIMLELELIDNINYTEYFESLRCNDYDRLIELLNYIKSLQNELIEL